MHNCVIMHRLDINVEVCPSLRHESGFIYILNQNNNPVLTDMDVNKDRIDTNIQVVTTCFKSTSLIGFYGGSEHFS